MFAVNFNSRRAMRSLQHMLMLVIIVFGSLLSLVLSSSTKSSISSTADKTRSLQALTSLNEASVGSTTFALVDSYDCNPDMVKTVREFFKANDAMFTRCIADSGYKLYPYTGILPNATIVTRLVRSDACMSIITAVVLLQMPPCILDDLEMRAACETVLYYSTALRHGNEAPTSKEFYELMIWRHHVNLAKASGKPYDGKSKTYSDFTDYLGDAITTSKTTVVDDSKVIFSTQRENLHEKNDSVLPLYNFSTPLMNYVVGRVSVTEERDDDVLMTSSSGMVVSLEFSIAATMVAPVMTLATTVVLLLAATL